LIATASGAHAVDLIASGTFDRMVIWRSRQVTSVPLAEALAQYNTVRSDDTLVHAARSLGICLGD
jgi:ATP-dependent phosphofructokinase / diphosphate-dependent phosphofructokinase